MEINASDTRLLVFEWIESRQRQSGDFGEWRVMGSNGKKILFPTTDLQTTEAKDVSACVLLSL